MKRDKGYSSSGLVPAEELNKATERRMNLLMLTLFAVVMAAVYGAFLVTNRQWSQVRAEQRVINAEFEQATHRIRELQELERQQKQMQDRAVLTASLIERVPRSILLAELINRMPERLSLLEFELTSSEYVPPKPKSDDKETDKTGKLSDKDKKKAERGKTKQQVAEETEKTVEPVLYNVAIAMVGAAPNDSDVSRYMSALNGHPLLSNVRLEFSEAKEIDERSMRQFRITMRLGHDADVRQINPLVVHRRIDNPMNEGSRISYEPGGEEN